MPQSPRCARRGRTKRAKAVAGWAVTQLIYAYAERIDHGTSPAWAELFGHATLTFEGFDNEVTGREAIEALYANTTRRYEDGTPRTKHLMTNVLVDVGGDGASATSRSYFTVLQAVPGAPDAPARDRRAVPPHLPAGRRPLARRDDARHDRSHGRARTPPALRPGAMKLSLSYGWDCTPEEFWALYFDPDFTVQMHLEALGSTSAEIVSQEGDLPAGWCGRSATGRSRTCRARCARSSAKRS